MNGEHNKGIGLPADSDDGDAMETASGSLDGIELVPFDGSGDAGKTDSEVTGINLDAFFDDHGSGPGIWKPSGTATSGSTVAGHDRASGPDQTAAARPPRKRQYPAGFAAMAVILRKGLSGTLKISTGEEVVSALVENGRVVNVSHPSLTPQALSNLLVTVGLITNKHLARAEKRSRNRNCPIDDEVLRVGRVSRATYENLREMQCTEQIMAAMLDNNASVSLVRDSAVGVRRNCSLPLPFLVREAQRRMREMPEIARAVPDLDGVFVRSNQIDPTLADERWEDLEMSGAERQAYFFVDGRRSVRQLAFVTSQSTFNVSRSVASLARKGYVVQTLQPDRKTARSTVGSAALRAATMIAAFAGLMAVLAVFAGPAANAGSQGTGITQLAYGHLLQSASESRVAGASFVYRLTRNEMASSGERLLDEGLILPVDVRTAAAVDWGRTQTENVGENTVDSPDGGNPDQQPKSDEAPADDDNNNETPRGTDDPE